MTNTFLGNIVKDTTPITQSTLLSLDNMGDMLNVNSSSTVVLTIPNSTVIPIGSTIQVNNLGTGDVFVEAQSPHTVISSSGVKLDGQNSTAYLIKIDSTTWSLTGKVAAGNYLLLDAYSGAAVAYSLRKLRTAYTGSVLRVRAGTTNAEGDVAFDTNNTVSANSIVTVTSVGTSGLTVGQQVTFNAFWNAGSSNQSVFVTIWYDQSGNSGRNVIQTTAANQPRIVTNGVILTDNSKPSISSLAQGGSYQGRLLTSSNVINSATQHSFVTGSVAANATHWQVMFSTSNSGGSLDGFEYFMQAGTLNFISVNGSWFFNGRSKGFSYELNVPLNQLYTANLLDTVGNISTKPVSIFTSNMDSHQWRGTMSEAIIYTTDRSTTRAQIEININNHYQIY
jgi:molybdopterin-binding protein